MKAPHTETASLLTLPPLSPATLALLIELCANTPIAADAATDQGQRHAGRDAADGNGRVR